MPTLTTNTTDQVTAICERLLKLYTGAIADMLDKGGYRNQVLPASLIPLTIENRVAGPAFTGQGYPCASPTDNDMPRRLEMLASITPGSVSVWSCGASTDCAHWGEIMSTAARVRGGVGAVIDGGVRDLDFLNTMQFPVFARFKCAASSVGRWSIHEYQVPIRIGDVLIHPGDYVFGDIDGVVVIPQNIVLDVLGSAEDVYQRETSMRRELRAGAPIQTVYEKYGAL